MLLQLFVLYYGLASVVRLPPFVAALLGLGLNYAAYESEIYRASLEAVPKGQLEAARTLGFSTWQSLRLIRGPQAFRYALAPMTNDFVALLKDSSLVSVLTVVELTKQTQIFATNLGYVGDPRRAVRALVSGAVVAAGAAGATARTALEGADRMTTSVLTVEGLRLSRGSREILRGLDLEVAARGAGGVDGAVGVGQDHGAAGGGGARAVLRRPHHRGRPHAGRRAPAITPSCIARSAWCSSSTACGITSRPLRTCGSRPCTSTAPRTAAAQARARELLAELGVGHRETALPAELSGGEAQRVAIARALAADPKLLLMDEPTASLDPARRGELGDTLRRLASTGRSLLLTCHDDDFVRDFATRVLVLADGQVVEQGDPQTVLTAPTHEATRRLLDLRAAPTSAG